MIFPVENEKSEKKLMKNNFSAENLLWKFDSDRGVEFSVLL